MDLKFSDLSLSTINLYDDFVNYLMVNKNYKLSKIPLLGKTKFAKRMMEKNVSKIRFSEFLQYFERVLRSNFKEDWLHNFDDNIADLELISACFQLGDLLKKAPKYGGMYDIKKNRMIINIKDKNEFLSIYHELFHLASTNRMITTHIQTGFRVVKNGISTGLMLNEGYTDLMAYRYFGNVGAYPGYPLAFQYVSALEQIVGKEFMEKCYLSSNPNALVHNLERYDSMDNIINFINLLDCTENLNEPLPALGSKINAITTYLLKWYVRKAILDGENIYDPAVRNRIINFAGQLPSRIASARCPNMKVNVYGLLDQVVEEVMSMYAPNYRRY